jgi:beta-N-acetylhexosaminidase
MQINRWMAGALVVLLTIFSLIWRGGGRADANPDAAAQLPAIVKGMSLEEKVGQMFMPDFRQWDGEDVTEINEEIVQAIQQHHLGGVILFRENLVETGQIVRLVDQLQRAAGKIPLLISTDQEGGVVNRLQSGTVMPGNMALGATRSTEDSRRVGQAIGAELHALGINVNFAPVVDVNVNPDNPVIGVRSFGADPQLVSELGVSYIQGLHDAGVAATAKHFPGHGDTAVDSHLGLPSVPHDLSRLNAVELKPFQAAINGGVDLIMTAHVTFPAIDSSMVISRLDNTPIYVPATLSSRVLTGLIRNTMGFEGVVITDSLQMKAITDHFGPEDAVIRAVQAGTDIILMPSDLSRAYQAVLSAVKNGVIPEATIDQSVTRILALKLKLGVLEVNNGRLQPGDEVSRPLEGKINNALNVVGCLQHRSLEQEVAGQAVTLLKNEDNILPFKLSNGKKVVLLAPWQDRLELMMQSLMQIISDKSLQVDVKGFSYTDLAALNDEHKTAIDGADFVLLGSSSYDVDSRTPGKNWTPDYVKNAVDYCREQRKAIAVVAIRNPYDIMYIPDVPAYICIYGRAEGPDIPAGIMAVFGELNPGGKLPVSIPNIEGGILYPLGYGLSYGSKANEYPAGSPRVLLNAQHLSLAPAPFLENGRCIVPLRQVVEATGGQVSWDQERQEATVSWPGIVAVIKAGSSTVLVNNQHIPMDVEARIQADRMLVPLRFIAQIGMAELWWDSATSTVFMQLPPGRQVSG